MRSTIKDFGSGISCQVVHALVNVLVEAEDPLQVEGSHAIAFLWLSHLLAIITILLHF